MMGRDAALRRPRPSAERGRNEYDLKNRILIAAKRRKRRIKTDGLDALMAGIAFTQWVKFCFGSG